MVFIVQYTRYFEEFGCNDIDTKEFDNLKEANDFYNERLTLCGDTSVKLYAGKDRIR